MARRIMREQQEQRGCLGWGFLIIFILFNAFMVYAVVGGLANVGSLAPATTAAEQTGRGIGLTLGLGFLLFIWAAGDLVLGIPVLLTRGRRVMIEETDDGSREDPRLVDTSRWSQRDREDYERRNSMIDVTPRLAGPPSRDAARYQECRAACQSLKLLAESGKGLDEQTVAAILDYVEAEIGSRLTRQDAAAAARWLNGLPADETSARDAVRRLAQEVGDRNAFILAAETIAGDPPSSELQARWLTALKQRVGSR